MTLIYHAVLGRTVAVPTESVASWTADGSGWSVIGDGVGQVLPLAVLDGGTP